MMMPILSKWLQLVTHQWPLLLPCPAATLTHLSFLDLMEAAPHTSRPSKSSANHRLWM